jgi:hypothetical protein
MENSIVDKTTNILDNELSELEDSYAECLADEVDPGTLLMLWLRIKSLRQDIESRTKVV